MRFWNKGDLVLLNHDNRSHVLWLYNGPPHRLVRVGLTIWCENQEKICIHVVNKFQQSLKLLLTVPTWTRSLTAIAWRHMNSSMSGYFPYNHKLDMVHSRGENTVLNNVKTILKALRFSLNVTFLFNKMFISKHLS